MSQAVNEIKKLPQGWRRAPLRETADIVRGISFPKEARRLEPQEGSVACLRTANVQREVDWGDLWFVPEEYVKLESRYVRLFDVLISVSNSLELVGKVAQVTSLPHKSTLGAFISLLRPSTEIDAKLYYYQLTSSDVQSEIRRYASTTTNISNISSSRLAEIPLSVPPLPEQRRIVAEIEKQFTRLNASVAALKRVQANLKRYRSSVLKAACEGKLVPTEAELARTKDCDYEPADQLLERILAERRVQWEAQEKRGRKYKEPVAPDTTDLPGLPEGWTWVPADQLSDIVSGQTPKGIVNIAEDSITGIPWYRVSDMNLPDNDTNMAVASSLISEANVTRFRLHIRPPGTIIFPKRGGAIATNKKRRLSVPAAYDLNTMGMIPEDGLGDYLWWWFQTIDLSTLGDGSNVPQINHDDIQGLPIPLPPLAEQRRIVAEVERCLSVVRQAEAAVGVNLARAERLRQSLLKQAFSGKLVPQDPNDEPASALLERIRVEREAAQADAQHKRNTRLRRAERAKV